MKYFPLIWAALWRKPVRTVLTFLAAVAAFTLFGLTIGLNATYGGIVARARADRVYVNPHFIENGNLTLAQRGRIARMPDVREIGGGDFFLGYYRDPKNQVVPFFLDHGMRRAYPEIPLTPAQWDRLQADPSGVFLDNHTAARLGLKAGDNMPVLTPAPSRRDGSKLWPFHVLGVVENPPWARGGLTLANFDYLEQTRPLAQVGHVGQFNILLKNSDRVAALAQQVDRIVLDLRAQYRALERGDQIGGQARAVGDRCQFAGGRGRVERIGDCVFDDGEHLCQAQADRLAVRG